VGGPNRPLVVNSWLRDFSCRGEAWRGEALCERREQWSVSLSLRSDPIPGKDMHRGDPPYRRIDGSRKSMGVYCKTRHRKRFKNLDNAKFLRLRMKRRKRKGKRKMDNKMGELNTKGGKYLQKGGMYSTCRVDMIQPWEWKI
jgi:hypothetical protein